MVRYLVTGGAGFIGSHLVRALVDRGDRVVVLDDLSSGEEANVEPLGDAVELHRVDIGADPMDAYFDRVDTVFHLAAVASVAQSVAEPVASHRTNVTGTLRVLDAARRMGVRRWVGASSSAVYGDDAALPKRETMPHDPVSPYGAHKAMLELHAQSYWRTYRLETVSLRYFNVFGPRQRPDSEYSGVMARFIPALLEGRRPVIHGDGEQSRDFVSVRDVVRANLCASSAEGVAGGVFNIATGRSRSVKELLVRIQAQLGTAAEPRQAPPRDGDIRHSVADISLAAARLGWVPEDVFDRALRSTIDWYRTLVPDAVGTGPD